MQKEKKKRKKWEDKRKKNKNKRLQISGHMLKNVKTFKKKKIQTKTTRAKLKLSTLQSLRKQKKNYSLDMMQKKKKQILNIFLLLII